MGKIKQKLMEISQELGCEGEVTNEIVRKYFEKLISDFKSRNDNTLDKQEKK